METITDTTEIEQTNIQSTQVRIEGANTSSEADSDNEMQMEYTTVTHKNRNRSSPTNSSENAPVKTIDKKQTEPKEKPQLTIDPQENKLTENNTEQELDQPEEIPITRKTKTRIENMFGPLKQHIRNNQEEYFFDYITLKKLH